MKRPDANGPAVAGPSRAGRKNRSVALVAAQAVLDAADGVLNLAFGLVHLAFGFRLGIAGQLAGSFLDAALDVLGAAFNTIIVDWHSFLLLLNVFGRNVRVLAMFRARSGAELRVRQDRAHGPER